VPGQALAEAGALDHPAYGRRHQPRDEPADQQDRDRRDDVRDRAAQRVLEVLP